MVHSHPWPRENYPASQAIPGYYGIQTALTVWDFTLSGYEELHLLGNSAMWSIEGQPTHRRKLSPSPSWKRQITRGRNWGISQLI
jgi:hypothetical protein